MLLVFISLLSLQSPKVTGSYAPFYAVDIQSCITFWVILQTQGVQGVPFLGMVCDGKLSENS